MLIKLLVLAVALTLVTGQGTSDGTVILSRNGVRSNTYTSGIVEVYNNGLWSGICDDGSFGQDEADVVCHQLGYESADSYSNTGEQSFGAPSTILYSQVSCFNSDHLVLFQCDVTIIASCQSNNAITVSCSSNSLSASPFSGQVRLTGGSYTSEGLVEVYCNDEWGTICDDSFDTDDASTICAQLGYTRAATFDSGVYQGTADQPIWYRIPGCFSFDSCLTSCSSCGSTDYSGICSHSEDVSVQCQSDIINVDSSTTGSCDSQDIPGIGDGTIALSGSCNGTCVRSNTFTSGIVEIYYNGLWSGICDDGSFGQDEADVVCHQLGYESADSYSNTAEQSFVELTPIGYSQVSCFNSNYLVLFQCDLTTSTTCQSNNAVTVSCSSTSLSDSPFSGQVRLTGGSYTSEGLVEVYCNDTWGTICDGSFDSDDANTICTQLGYTRAATFESDVYQGMADQPIWYRTPGCTSLDSCLTSCSSCGSTNYLGICSRSEDVSVQCESDIINTDTSTTGSCDFTDLINALTNLVGIIVGVVIGVIVLIALCIAIPAIICCCCVGGAACCAGCAIAKA